MSRLAASLALCVPLMTGSMRPGPAPETPAAQAACTGQWRSLPAPRQTGPVSLEQSLARRRSVREFAPRPLPDDILAQLLWAAQGQTSPQGLRTAPSAGALYPLELYAATERGLLHYDPRRHCVRTVNPRDLRSALQRAALAQAAVGEAAVVFVVAAVDQRTAVKYGPRAERYVNLEAGHAAQNLLLQATALELGAVPIGAFQDADVSAVLGLSPAERPVYLLAVGWPR